MPLGDARENSVAMDLTEEQELGKVLKQKIEWSRNRRRNGGVRKEKKENGWALLVKPTDGKSYAEVLCQVKQAVRPDEMDAAIRAVRQTRAGGLLVEFWPDAAHKDSFNDAVRKALGEKASVSSLEPRVTLKIRDIDCVTDMGEVEDVLRREFPTAGEIKVRVIPENNRGQRVAILYFIERDAKPMLEKGKIKVG